MEETIIPKDTSIEKYFSKLPYTEKDRLHRYRKVDTPFVDEYSRLHRAKQEDVRKGKVINNRCYRNLGAGSWELIGTKLPNGDIITTDKKYSESLKTKGFLINTGDDWENEKELERIEKLCRDSVVGSILDYRTLMKL